MDIRPCDIIIPVYNAPTELKECIDSLLKYTNLSKIRIVIINDCSPDPRVNEYLKTLTEDDRFIILQNIENLGFVGTVNRGMKLSNNDVVLLNSDTVVTNNWLEKITEVAYSETDIATVTPLTNNGTICSVPNFLEDNTLPDGYDIDSFAHFIEQISLKQFPEIPTAVGFCMFIKRTVIDEVGFFDEENFGKGYGEENDFCCRVIEHGYKNVLDDHTFIFHKGSMSFQGEKLELSKRNLKTLNSMYPYYEKMIHDFIVKNPLKSIHENIKLRIPYYANSYKTKGNILYILHNFFDEAYNHPIGGTEYHVKDIVSELSDYNAFVLVASENEVVLKQYIHGDFVAKYNFALKNPLSPLHFHHKEYSDIVEKIIGSFEITLVHIHHLIKHSFDVPYIAHRNNIKVLFTLHDFHLFSAITSDDNIVIYSDAKPTSYESSSVFIKRRKQEVERVIPYIDLFITPTNFTKELFENEYPMMNGKIIVMEHGASESVVSWTSSNHEKTKVWNIGFLGGLSPVKGSELIYRLVTSYPKNKVNWHLIGGLGDQRLNILEQHNVKKYGEYKREDLEKIIESLELDLICSLSIVPETFSYTLSEAWMFGIPVLVTPKGALKERVEKVGGGWIAESSEFEDILKKLNEIMKLEETEWIKVENNIKAYKFITKQEMILQYVKLYDNYSTSKDALYFDVVFDNDKILRALKYYMPTDIEVSVYEHDNHIQRLEAELRAMRETIGWKVLSRLRSNNSGILRLGKKVIYFILKFRRS